MDIEYFFNKQNLSSYDEELVALMRRLDFDGDGKITYKDFSC